MDQDVRMQRLRGMKLTGTVSAKKALDSFIETVVREPRRLNMSTWGEPWRHSQMRPKGQEEAPECGTMACEAGWIHIRILGKPIGFDDDSLSGREIAHLIAGFGPPFDDLYYGIFTNDMLTDNISAFRFDVDAVVAKTLEFQNRYAHMLERRRIDTELTGADHKRRLAIEEGYHSDQKSLEIDLNALRYKDEAQDR